jgi:hypothetical protein
VHFPGNPGWFQLDCSIRIAAELGEQLDDAAVSELEHDAARVLKRFINRRLK